MEKDERLFRSLADCSPVGLYLADVNGNCKYVNKSWCRMAGLEPDEALGQGWREGIFPGDRNRIREQWSRLVEGKEQWDLEYRFQDRRGNITWVHGTATPFHNDQFSGYLGTNVDITERKQAEEEIQKKSHQQNVILDSIPSVTMLIRHDTKEVLACNKAAERVGVVVGQTCYKTRHNKNKPCSSCLANELRATGKKQYLQTREDGCYRDNYWVPVTEDLYLFYAYDNTKQKIIEESLRESEEKFRRLFTDSTVAMSLLTMDRTLLQVNNALCDFLGYSKYEFETLRLEDITHSDDLEKSLLSHTNLISGQSRSFSMEKRFIHKNGTLKWGLITVSVIPNEKGQPLYHLAQVVDITERKEAVAALLEYQKKLQSVASELLLAEENLQKKIGGELHDGVCQLLVSCKMSLGRLKDSLENQAAVCYVKEISATMDRAIEQIRTLSFNLTNPVLFELGFCKAIEDLAEDYLQKKHNIRTNIICEDLKCKGLAPHLSDELKGVVYRAVKELFVNIVKHAHADTVEIKITCKQKLLRVKIVDDGVGFDYAAELNNRKSGHKLGLFIIMERLGYFQGRIDLEASQGKGTKAVIEVPLSRREGACE